MVERQQVLIQIIGPEELFTVSIMGDQEVAIVGQKGVFHNTVTFLTNEKDLRKSMKKWFGE